MPAQLGSLSADWWQGDWSASALRTVATEGPNGTVLQVLPNGSAPFQIMFFVVTDSPVNLDGAVGTIVAVACPGGGPTGSFHLEAVHHDTCECLQKEVMVYFEKITATLRRVPT